MSGRGITSQQACEKPDQPSTPRGRGRGRCRHRPAPRKRGRLLGEHEENRLVEWIEAHPILYNTKLKAYYQKPEKKDKLWQEKADELDVDVVDLRVWYRALATVFTVMTWAGKCVHAAARLTERECWILTKFQFLKMYVRRPKTIVAWPWVAEEESKPKWVPAGQWVPQEDSESEPEH